MTSRLGLTLAALLVASPAMARRPKRIAQAAEPAPLPPLPSAPPPAASAPAPTPTQVSPPPPPASTSPAPAPPSMGASPVAPTAASASGGATPAASGASCAGGSCGGCASCDSCGACSSCRDGACSTCSSGHCDHGCDRCGACCKDKKPWERTSVFGIRGSYLNVSGVEDASTVGVALAGSAEEYKTDGLFAGRAASSFVLGGGSGGFEGQLAGAIALGLRVPFGAEHGPVARIGLGGEMLGNNKLYYSHLEIPLAEVGYQYQAGRTLFELGARGAPVLTGRFNTGDSQRRELGTSFEWGPYVALHSRYGRLDGTFTRIEARKDDPGTPVDVLRGTACLYAGDVAAMCLDGMYIRGDEAPPVALPPVGGALPAAVTLAPNLETHAFYGGLSINLYGF